MAEYIEKHKLLQDMHSVHTSPIFHKTDEDYMFERMVGIVNEQPSADVVKVVRCKDCKYLYCLSAVDRRFYCKRSNGLTGINIVEDNPFCSYGELKECVGE